MRALILLHRRLGSLPLGARLHSILRFLTCPFLRVVDHLPADGTLLDIGAGHGVFAVLARDRGLRVVAVEPDVRKMNHETSVVGYDDVVRGCFDVISIIDVLYKIPIAEWDALLARCAARLPPGALLLIKEQDPIAWLKSSWNRVQEAAASAIDLTLGEAFAYEAPETFAARLRRHGFEASAERIDRGYPHAHILYKGRRMKDEDEG